MPDEHQEECRRDDDHARCDRFADVRGATWAREVSQVRGAPPHATAAVAQASEDSVRTEVAWRPRRLTCQVPASVSTRTSWHPGGHQGPTPGALPLSFDVDGAIRRDAVDVDRQRSAYEGGHPKRKRLHSSRHDDSVAHVLVGDHPSKQLAVQGVEVEPRF